MKKFFIAAFAVTVLFSCSSKKDKNKTDNKTAGTDNTVTEQKKSGNLPMPDTATANKNWQDFMTPGEMHKMMAKWDGTWDSDITMWQAPGAPAEKATGTSTNKMIMNGLYQESNHVSTMMGMPFNGKSIIGYDNHKKMFVMSWIDNLGSGIMMLEGPWDEASKSVTLKGNMTDPATKGTAEMKEVFKVVDDNNHLMEMYAWHDGKEFKTMEIKYSRKK